MNNQTIWKYPLEVTDEQIIYMPSGADILAVQTQDDTPNLWVLVHIGEVPEPRQIHTRGTGQPLQGWEGVGPSYIGTYQLMRGGLVFHVFEKLS